VVFDIAVHQFANVVAFEDSEPSLFGLGDNGSVSTGGHDPAVRPPRRGSTRRAGRPVP